MRQAATLIEALVERFPGSIEDAVQAVPKSAGRYVKRAVEAPRQHLPPTAEAAWEAIMR